MSSRPNLRPVAPSAEGPPTEAPDQAPFIERVRDALSVRLQRWDERYPKVLDLEAGLVAALHQALHGCASAVSGVEAPEHFREMLRGERSLRSVHVARLALSVRPEAGRAVDRYLEILAEVRGCRVERNPTAGDSLARAASRFSRECGDVAPAIFDALADGRLDPQELDDVDRELDEAINEAGNLKAVVAQARGRLARGDGAGE